MECIFCKIVKKEIPASIIFENEHVLAFQDLHPQSPTHILIIPKKHIATLNDFTAGDAHLYQHLLETVPVIAKQLGVHEKGYRVAINCNEWGGQTVFHVHVHLMGGKQLGGSMVG